jgi:hypothetical protein
LQGSQLLLEEEVMAAAAPRPAINKGLSTAKIFVK